MRNLPITSKRFKGRVVLRGHNVKDHNGYTAVLTEQGANSLDTISRLPGMAGFANDAADITSERPQVWTRLPLTRGAKLCDAHEETEVLRERNLCGHPHARLLRETKWLEEVRLKNTWMGTNLGMCLHVQ